MQNLRAKLKKQGGFTLVEMLIVVAIIAILIAISIPLVNTALEKARDATDDANFRSAIGLGNILLLTDETLPSTGDTVYYYYISDTDGVSGKLAEVKSGGTAPTGYTAYKSQCTNPVTGDAAGTHGATNTKANAYIQITINKSNENAVVAKWTTAAPSFS